MPEKINFSKRHIERLRKRRGAAASNRQDLPHASNHRPIAHHKEPVLRDIFEEQTSQATATETDSTHAQIAENLVVARSRAVEAMFETIRVSRESGFEFSLFVDITTPSSENEQINREPELSQLTPIVKTHNHNLTVIGHYTQTETAPGRFQVFISDASLIAVQVKPTGVSVIENILSVDISDGAYFKNNLGKDADQFHLSFTANLLRGMHDQIAQGQPGHTQ